MMKSTIKAVVIAIIVAIIADTILKGFKKGSGKDEIKGGKVSSGTSHSDRKYADIPVYEWEQNVKGIVGDGPLQKAFDLVKAMYGKEVAEVAEKIYRLETSHFKSGQFVRGYSPGMRAFSFTYPYGWNMFKEAWDKNPIAKPTHIHWKMVKGEDGITKPYYYLGFSDFKFPLLALAEYIKTFGPARWNSTKPEQQAIYLSRLKGIVNKFV